MRCYPYNATSVSVLWFWFLAVALLLTNEATVVLADPSCTQSCTGVMCCAGCGAAYTSFDGKIIYYIQVPPCQDLKSYYYMCGPDLSGNWTCTSQNISCYTVPQGQPVTYYSDNNCSLNPVNSKGIYYVIVTGCLTSDACGGT